MEIHYHGSRKTRLFVITQLMLKSDYLKTEIKKYQNEASQHKQKTQIVTNMLYQSYQFYRPCLLGTRNWKEDPTRRSEP